MHRYLVPVIAIASAVLWPVHAAKADNLTSDPRLIVTEVTDGLQSPWGLAFLPDGRYLVTERVGTLRIVAKDGTVSDPLPGVPDVVASGQGGLLDVALDRDFATNRTLYLSYAGRTSDGVATVVARALMSDDGLTGLEVIFEQTPGRSGGRHFGSRIVQADDGTLFVTTGDRGVRSEVQDWGNTIGKVIRIRTDGSVPDDNPFVGQSGYQPEIWSGGHRNIQGADLHPETRELWTVEHGARGGDEINRPEAGKNYGWPTISYGRHYHGGKIGEGTEKPGLEQPVYYWDPSIAPSGLTFYDGEAFPQWKGDIFVGALRGAKVVRLNVEDGKVLGEEPMLEDLRSRIRDVRTGPDGLLYLLTDSANGQLLRVAPSGRS